MRIQKLSLIMAFLSLYVLFLFSGCFDSPKEPVMPNWDVELNVPITEKLYKMSEILDPSKNIKIVDEPGIGDSLYLFLVNDIDNTFKINDEITIPFNPVPEELNVSGVASETQPQTNAIVYNPEPDYHIDTAIFKSGEIVMNLDNNGNGSVNYELVMPGFKNKSDNSIYNDKGVLGPNETKTLKISLKDFNYAELKIEPGLNDRKNYKFQAKEGFFIVAKAWPSSGSVDVDFRSGVTSDDITISRMTGRLKRIEIQGDTRIIQTSFGNDIHQFSQVDFKEMRMQLFPRTFGEMRNIKIILDELKITGYKKSNSGQRYSPVSLQLNSQETFSDTIIAGEVNSPTVFTESNSNLIAFIKNLPQEIELNSKVILDRNSSKADSIQVISAHDSIRFSVDIEAPLKISAKDAEFQDTIDLDIDLSQEDKDNITEAKNANLTLEVENYIPLGALAKASFYDENYNFLFTVKNTNGGSHEELQVHPSNVDADGIPTTPGRDKVTVILEKDEILKFKEAKYLVIDLKMRSSGFDTTNPPFVQVRAKDVIKVKVYGGVNYHFNPEDE